MNENDRASEDGHHTSDNTHDVPIDHQSPTAPQKPQIADRAHQKGQNILSRLGKPLRAIVNWIDGHDGLMTALATLAIAYFTWSIAHDSAGQLEAIRGQLTEMKTSRKGSDQTTASQLKSMQDQTTAMQGQLDAMKTDQRPWVFADAVITTDLQWHDGRSPFTVLEYRIRNTGHSPALGAHVVATFFFGDETESEVALQSYCGNQKTNISGGSPIFPGQSVTWFKWVVQSANAAPVAPLPPDNLSLEILGCINYTAVSDQTVHQTAFRFIVMQRHAKGAPRRLLTLGQPVLADLVVLHPGDPLGYAN